jgi:transcription elongation factor Elf1
VTAYVVCKRCGYRIPLRVRLRSEAPLHFTATCPSCGHTDVYHRLEIVEEGVYRHLCDVCDTQLYSFRLGPARCPVCGSRYIVTANKWQLVERGSAPPRPTQVLGAAGLVIGGIAGTSRGEKVSEKIVNMIAGSITGFLLGTIIGAFIEALTRVEREVVYE